MDKKEIADASVSMLFKLGSKFAFSDSDEDQVFFLLFHQTKKPVMGRLAQQILVRKVRMRMMMPLFNFATREFI